MLAQWIMVWMACTPSAEPPPSTTPPSNNDTADTADTAIPPDTGDTVDTGGTDTGDTGGDDPPPSSLPANWMNPHGADQHELWSSLDEWPKSRAMTDVIAFYIQAVEEDQRGHVTTAVQALTKLGIGIAVESGGTLASEGCGSDVGELSAATELAKLQTISDAGGQLAYLSLDGPISRTVASGRDDNCGFTVEASAEALVRYVSTVRAAQPDLQIGWLVNFPNWSYGEIAAYQCATKDYGDLQEVFEVVMRAMADAGEHLDYLMIDQPYDYAMGLQESNCHSQPETVDWLGRSLALEAQARSHGLKVGQIYNSSRGGSTSNALFHSDTVAWATAHHTAGGRPDIRMVSSWYTYPDIVLPEDGADTFAATALATWQAADASTGGGQ